MEVRRQNQAPAASLLREYGGIYSTAGWVGFRAHLEVL